MKLAAQLDDFVRGQTRVGIVADNDGVGFILGARTVSPAFRWDDVTENRVFKRDLGIVDDARLAFHVHDRWFGFSEEQSGFARLGQTMCDVFPQITAEWFTEVLQPPFATNERILFRRPSSDRTGWAR